jgi:hypothetical protein
LFRYTAYGLGIHSFLPLPELICDEKKADVVFRLGKVNGSNLHAVDEASRFKATSEEAYYFFDGVGSFLARADKKSLLTRSQALMSELFASASSVPPWP